ncbi:MAG TPA: LacI family DNA-binding transcriptional regulator [Paracoccaceae bacterium]|nr:LacI family DNA-binding transcriptional regulator [Paracoccaceae bacterium]
MRDDQTVTIADVARQAGVSPMTVSKVLRDTGRVSAETRARVKRAADELGYVPNGLAGALAARSTPIVGVLIPSVSDGVYAEVLAGINAVLRPQGFQTFIGETFFNPDIEAALLRTMLPFRPAGLILAGGIARTPAADRLLLHRATPAVQIWDGDNPALDATVGLSHREAGRMAARHFLDLGARHCAYVGAQLQADICARLRLEGFREGLAEAGATLIEVTDPDLPRQTDTGRDLTARLLSQGVQVDAIHFLNDAMALGGLRQLFAAGIDVPGDVAVMGFNGTSCATAVRTRLTTLDLPRDQIGRRAAQAILSLRATGGTLAPLLIAPRLVRGNTTG